MIYVTGDTHGDLGYFLSLEERKALAPRNRNQEFFDPASACRDPGWSGDDKVIIAGDFGFVFMGEAENAIEREKLDILSRKPYEILFVDGNHEGFPSLVKYPQEQRYGGPVRKLRENIYWLQRGYVYTIEGNTFFTMGGAYSIDKAWRLNYEDFYGDKIWFEEELPTEEEYQRATQALQNVGMKVDFIVTHTVPSRYFLRLLRKEPSVEDGDFQLMDFLEWDVYRKVRFEKWFFGHFHQDQEFFDGMVACMDDVHRI